MPFKSTHGIPSPGWGCGHALECPHWAVGSGRASSSSSTTSSFQAVCVDDVPALMTKTALCRLSKCLVLAAVSSRGSAGVAQGAPAEHPGVTRALPGKALMPGSQGGRGRLSLARDTEMPSDSVGAMKSIFRLQGRGKSCFPRSSGRCYHSRTVMRAIFPEYWE